MFDEHKPASVATGDVKESIAAAFARIKEVPVGHTLIDEICADEWKSDDPFDWEITVGSTSADDADELDSIDEVVVHVA